MADDNEQNKLPNDEDDDLRLDPPFPYTFIRFDPLLLNVDILPMDDTES